MSSTPPLSPLDVCFCLQVSLSHPAQNIRDITKVKMCRYFWGRGVNTTKYNLNLSSSRKRITDTTWWDEEKTSVTGAVRTGGTGLGRRTRKVSPPLTLYPEVLWRNCNMNVFFLSVLTGCSRGCGHVSRGCPGLGGSGVNAQGFTFYVMIDSSCPENQII